MNSAEQKELEALRRYFNVCENAFGKQHWNADAILSHFNEDGSLKGEGKWRGKEIHAWLLKWQAAQDELNAIEFSGDARSACDGEDASISPNLLRHYKQAAHEIGDLFCWCVQNLEKFPPMEGNWIDEIKLRLNAAREGQS